MHIYLLCFSRMTSNGNSCIFFRSLFVSAGRHCHFLVLCPVESPVLKWLCFMWCGAATLALLALPKLIIDSSTTLDTQVGTLCVTCFILYICIHVCRGCSWTNFLFSLEFQISGNLWLYMWILGIYLLPQLPFSPAL